MKSVLLLIIGFALGASLVALVPAMHKQNSDDLEFASRKLLVESSIEAIDALQKGDNQTAELILASTVNSQIVVFEKMQRQAKDKEQAANWRKQMNEHNQRLGLKVPAPRATKEDGGN